MATLRRYPSLITSNKLQYYGIQFVKGGTVDMPFKIYNDSLVGKRVVVKDKGRLATVVQDGSHTVKPFVVVRLDNEPDMLTVYSLDDIVVIGGVQAQ
jgi:hypothetical protein